MTSGYAQISEHKKQLRKLISAERSSMPENVRLQKSEIICQQAINHFKSLYDFEQMSYYVLYTYIPFRVELNIMPIVEWCWQSGIRVAAPRILSLVNELQFHYITGHEDLLPQPPWGIYEPLANTPRVQYDLQPGCILVPGVAFDLNRARLGYGGGYYDKFLSKLNELNVNLFKLALALDLQIVQKVPCEQHDLPVDLIITETRVI
jgi:5-formyltetrahydrofolate cyclo-ligase